MIYSNRIITEGLVKLPVIPSSLMWNIFSDSSGDSYLALMYKGSREVKYSMFLPIPSKVAPDYQLKVIEAFAVSMKYDLMCEMFDLDDTDIETDAGVENSFPNVISLF